MRGFRLSGASPEKPGRTALRAASRKQRFVDSKQLLRFVPSFFDVTPGLSAPSGQPLSHQSGHVERRGVAKRPCHDCHEPPPRRNPGGAWKALDVLVHSRVPFLARDRWTRTSKPDRPAIRAPSPPVMRYPLAYDTCTRLSSKIGGTSAREARRLRPMTAPRGWIEPRDARFSACAKIKDSAGGEIRDAGRCSHVDCRRRRKRRP